MPETEKSLASLSACSSRGGDAGLEVCPRGAKRPGLGFTVWSHMEQVDVRKTERPSSLTVFLSS
jgi:hypothetical protein